MTAAPTVLPIVQVGHPALRQLARPLSIEELRGEEIQWLIASMRETMYVAPGVGLAAPQVGRALQLAVIEDRAEYFARMPPAEVAERERAAVDFHVLVNPRLTVVQAEPAPEFFEGCLSLHGYCALVARASVVRVEALDERGEPVTITARGWYARILQHEIDHLGGRVYIDRMAPRSFMTVENHARIWSELPAREVRDALGIGDGQR